MSEWAVDVAAYASVVEIRVTTIIPNCLRMQWKMTTPFSRKRSPISVLLSPESLRKGIAVELVMTG